MSRQITHAFGRSLVLASAALLIGVGSATAATAHDDFQSQVSAVLAGTGAAHSTARADAARSQATDTKIDAQQFARELLLGWSTSHPARAGGAAQPRDTGAYEVSAEDSSPQDDIQSTVQRFLRGE